MNFLNQLEDRYYKFMNSPQIQSFLKNNGKVYIATYGRNVEVIEKLISMGHRDFSEKFYQEGCTKFSDLVDKFPDINLSYFGKLQSNKIRKIISFFHTVESVSRIKEVDFLCRNPGDNTVKTKEFFIQYNIGNENQKNGVNIDQIYSLYNYCKVNNLFISGLMIIPPKYDEADMCFSKTKFIAEKLNLKKLQMGFSNDYQSAIQLGATSIRIGKEILN